MYEFSKEQMDKLLLSYDWTKITGYGMGYSAPESENIIVTIEEIKKFIFTTPTDFYSEKSNEEYSRELEDAFECLYDEVWQQNDLNLEADVDAWLLKDLTKLDAQEVKKHD